MSGWEVEASTWDIGTAELRFAAIFPLYTFKGQGDWLEGGAVVINRPRSGLWRAGSGRGSELSG